jgi:hypothetical protein
MNKCAELIKECFLDYSNSLKRPVSKKMNFFIEEIDNGLYYNPGRPICHFYSNGKELAIQFVFKAEKFLNILLSKHPLFKAQHKVVGEFFIFYEKDILPGERRYFINTDLYKMYWTRLSVTRKNGVYILSKRATRDFFIKQVPNQSPHINCNCWHCRGEVRTQIHSEDNSLPRLTPYLNYEVTDEQIMIMYHFNWHNLDKAADLWTKKAFSALF